MPALREILADRAPLLLLDAASSRVQVGLLGPGSKTQWAGSEEEAGAGVFRCLDQLPVDPARIAAFAFCEGPGSLLGIRTTAMVLRVWNVLQARPVYAFRSLEIVAHALGRPGVSVIADARRDTWHCTTIDADGVIQPLSRIATAALTGPLVKPEGFRHWSALPSAEVETIPYDLARLLPLVENVDLFHETRDPDAYLHEEPAYVIWTPRVHRAPPPAS